MERVIKGSDITSFFVYTKHSLRLQFENSIFLDIVQCAQEAYSRMIIRKGNCSVLRSTFELERERSILFLD